VAHLPLSLSILPGKSFRHRREGSPYVPRHFDGGGLELAIGRFFFFSHPGLRRGGIPFPIFFPLFFFSLAPGWRSISRFSPLFFLFLSCLAPHNRFLTFSFSLPVSSP